MARLRRVRSHAAWPLLALLCIFSAPAAAPTAEQAAREARAAIDQAQYDRGKSIIDDALKRFGSSEDETIWSLRVMRAQVFHVRGDQEAVLRELEKELPPALRTSDPAVRRLITLANAKIALNERNEAMQRLQQARAIAEKHHPALLGEIYAAMAIAAPTIRDVEEYAHKAIAVAKQNADRRVEARAMATLLYRSVGAGRYGDAIQWGEKALVITQSQKFERATQQIFVNMGWAYAELASTKPRQNCLPLLRRLPRA